MALHNAFEALAVESKQDALNSLVTSLLSAANAIQTAAESLNTKAVALNTNAVTVSNQISQPLTDAQLRAGDLNISLAGEQVAISNFPATQPVSASSLPLPTGAATEVTLSSLSGKLPATLGQKASAGSTSVVLASDQSDVKVSLDGEQVSVSNFPVTQAISVGTLPLPTGAATDANLLAILTKLPQALNDVLSVNASPELANVLSELNGTLQQIQLRLDVPAGFNPQLNRSRGTIIVESGTVTAVTGLQNIDSIRGRSLIYGIDSIAFNENVLSRLS